MSASASGRDGALDHGEVAVRFIEALAALDSQALRHALHPNAVWSRADGVQVEGREAITDALRNLPTVAVQEGPLRVTRGTEVAWFSRERARREDSGEGDAPRVDVIDFDATGQVRAWLTVGGAAASATSDGHQARALESYVERVGRGDSADVLQLFGPVCDVEDPVGTPVHAGRAAVEKFYGSGLSAITGTRLMGPPVVSGNLGAVPFRVELDLGDRAIALEVIDVMRFDADGLFSSMRAFWGRGNRHEI